MQIDIALTNQEHHLYQQINSQDGFQGQSPRKFLIPALTIKLF